MARLPAGQSSDPVCLRNPGGRVARAPSGFQGIPVREVAHNQFFSTGERIAKAGGKIVIHYYRTARFTVLAGDVAADIASASGYEDFSDMLVFDWCLRYFPRALRARSIRSAVWASIV